ncbi:YcgL domain-containing protein [Marinobacteraceae bacterium S3BR75-40.1]
MTDQMQCSVYKSSRREEMYAFVEQEAGVEAIPESLRAYFGEPHHVMDLVLTPDRKLARADAAKVMEMIREKGVYLQMPPENEELLQQAPDAGSRYG